MKLRLKGAAEEIEQAIHHILDKEAKVRMIEEMLHVMLAPLEQHIAAMECATLTVNGHISNKRIDRQLDWI